MPRHLPTGTVTFLFTDIEGSTRLLRQLGPEGYAEALAEHRRVLRDVFASTGGVEVDTQGDAFFVAFPTAAGAVSAAGSGQRELAPGPITVRMGLHTGAPTVTSEGYVGIDVHRGARVAALAHGGQVILSSATAALVENEPLRDLGRHRLKDFDTAAQLFQLGTGSFPPLRTPGAVDLPIPGTRFLGRERELFEAATVWLDRDPRVLTIVGPGGTGKTRFAIELARLLAEEADAGTVFIPLAPVRDPALAVPMIADRLGASGDTISAISGRLGEKRAHVVLDNLEQLLPAVALTLAELLAAAPSLRLVATSREPLRIAGEAEFDLPPLGETEAVTLFLERAQAIRADIGESPAVHELIRRLDGLPLAIELAAARIKLLGPEQLLERITRRLDILKGGRDADERHATLRATIAWSYDLLAPDERQLFARLAVFRGGCSLDDAEAVCGAQLETVASLLDKSLLRRRSEPNGDTRFWMLETIREFATERLAASGEEHALRQAQAALLLEVADAAGATAIVDTFHPWHFDLIQPEIDNIRAVLEWALAHDPETGLALAAALESFWVVRDPLEGASWLQRLLDAAPTVDPRLRAVALRALGGAYDIFGEPERAAPCYRESLTILESRDDEILAANLRIRTAWNAVMRGDGDDAWPIIEESLETFRRLDLRLPEGEVIGFLVRKAYGEGDLGLAVERALESAAIANEVGWTWWEAGLLNDAASIERERGDLETAERHARRALSLSLGLGDRMHIVFNGAELAVIAAARGDTALAGTLWGAVESEVADGRVGQWELHRGEIEELVLRACGSDFDRGYSVGSLMSIAEAADAEPEIP